MSFTDYLPSIVALVGIPAAAAVSYFRDVRLRNRQDKREDAIRAQAQEREDKLLQKRLDEWVSQQWWERKATTYSEIVESLWHIVESDRHDYDRFFEYPDSKETEEERSASIMDFQKNRNSLKKLADIGTFVISEEVTTILQSYFKKIDSLQSMEDYFNYVDSHYAASKECLNNVRIAALKDLGLQRGSLATTEPAKSS
jgi:hypothetical protein